MIEENTYDFVVVGAGAAGCIVATRLAEYGKYSVLVLEGGQDNSIDSNNINDYQKFLETTVTSFAPLYSRYYSNPLKKEICNSTEASPSLLNFSTAIQNDRFYAYPRGSGSAVHHAMVDGRGSKDVYDNIAKYVKDPIW